MASKIISKVWITKYALSKGIRVFENVENCADRMIRVAGRCSEYFHGNDWHATEEEAKIRFAEMLQRRIECIDREKKKLANTLLEVSSVQKNNAL